MISIKKMDIDYQCSFKRIKQVRYSVIVDFLFHNILVFQDLDLVLEQFLEVI